MHSVLSSIRKKCSDAIRRGAPMYNNGNIAECERIYMNLRQELISDCEKHINSPNQDQPPDYELLKTYDTMKGIKLKPSDRSNETRSIADQNAWALRKGLDEILVNLEQYNEPENQPNFDMQPMIKREIQNAISKGAPMYNDGNIVDCEKLYMNLLTEMLNPSNVHFSNLDSNLPKVHEHLLNTKQKLVKSDNSNQRNSMTDKNAWTLRHCLDTILKMETAESSISGGVTRNFTSTSKMESQPNFDMQPIIKREIQNAISKGAPMYNDGNIVGCEKLYMNLLTEMLNPSNVHFSNLDSNLPKVHEHLLNTKQKLVKSDNSNQRNSMTDKNAWTLRQCLDTILKMETGESSCSGGVTRNYKSTSKMAILLAPNTSGVSILNDGVMGGVSTSIWKDGIFSGKVRLDNNGGFASLRNPFQIPMNLSEFDGFYIKAGNMLGPLYENQEFCLIIKDSRCMQSMATNFKMKFTPTTGETVGTYKVSARVLNKPESFGRPIRDQWNCDMRQICEIGVMAIKPGVIGNFKIFIQEIGVFK